MSTVALISIKPVYANQILDGTKTIELRKSPMGLSQGDVVVVYSSAPEQCLAFWFRIKAVEVLPVEEMWNLRHSQLGIEYRDYRTYFDGASIAVGLHIGEVHEIAPIPLRDLVKLVPGFVPPQGIIWLRNDLGKFRQLLNVLSCPLPHDVFPQQSFSFDVQVPIAQA
jgi:predicted transcriptional regulator